MYPLDCGSGTAALTVLALIVALPALYVLAKSAWLVCNGPSRRGDQLIDALLYGSTAAIVLYLTHAPLLLSWTLCF